MDERRGAMGVFRRVLAALRRRRSPSPEAPAPADTRRPRRLSARLEENLDVLREIMGNPADLAVKRFFLGGESSQEMAVAYFKGLADDRLVQRAVIDPLLVSARDIFGRKVPKKGLLERVRSRLVRAQELFGLKTTDELVDRLLEGNTAILADGVRAALGVELLGWPKRGVEESPTEQTVRGPRESFVETVRDNVALVSRRLKTPLLVVEQMTVGRRSATDVRLLYLRGIAPPNVVAELRRRVESVDLDVVLDSGTIEELIRDHPFFPFSHHAVHGEARLAGGRPGRGEGGAAGGRFSFCPGCAQHVLHVLLDP